MTAPIVIYGDPISGNCLKVRWTADAAELDYDWVAVDILNGDTRTDEFLRLNPFGQVPVVVLPDGRALTQSNAIIVYLASTARSPLLPDDDFERAQVMHWLFWEQNSHEPYIAGRRFRVAYKKHRDDQIDREWLPRGEAALSRMESALLDQRYLVGERPTLADIALLAYTRVAGEGGFDISKYPSVQEWIGRVERDLSIRPAEAA